ncbi:hypothetical protein DTW92_02735 [Paracoccus pantotrophus]|uniref:hypothetical protein n=1 Tax=Paracoccus pantotrophus TaxID=82367 RepID=UPI000E098D80|nr:hypothetical protein [Paracoccus pantotrophus]RDD99823.1 hypothetical protein DTW92_02735 [Paracoccus pantotrophus]WGR65429.1 hypothetical protein E3U24_09225 [Paracoccus pantotrophus]
MANNTTKKSTKAMRPADPGYSGPNYFGNGLDLHLPSRAERKIARFSKGHFTGRIVASGGDGGYSAGRLIMVESHLEFCWCLVLLARRATADLREQAAFDWQDRDGKVHTHFFDFLVTERDGKRIACAVRPASRIGGRFGATMPRIAHQARKRGFADDVRLLTDDDLDQVDLFNAKLMHGMRQPQPEADIAAERAISEMTGIAVIEDLVRHIGMGADGYRAVVRLIRRHRLRLLDHVRIDYQAAVYAAPGYRV